MVQAWRVLLFLALTGLVIACCSVDADAYSMVSLLFLNSSVIRADCPPETVDGEWPPTPHDNRAYALVCGSTRATDFDPFQSAWSEGVNLLIDAGLHHEVLRPWKQQGDGSYKASFRHDRTIVLVWYRSGQVVAAFDVCGSHAHFPPNDPHPILIRHPPE